MYGNRELVGQDLTCDAMSNRSFYVCASGCGSASIRNNRWSDGEGSIQKASNQARVDRVT